MKNRTAGTDFQVWRAPSFKVTKYQDLLKYPLVSSGSLPFSRTLSMLSQHPTTTAEQEVAAHYRHFRNEFVAWAV